MASCINKSSREFQRLKQISGLPEYQLEYACRFFVDRYNRFPNLDELHNANSENYVKSLIHVDNGFCSTENLLQATKTQTVEEAIPVLNNEYRDLQIYGLQLKDSVLIDITHKPQPTTKLKPAEYQQNVHNNFMVLDQLTSKLSELYGIPIETVSVKEIQNNPELQTLVDAQTTQSFIYNDKIYVNSDIASIDAPIHELLHIFVGSMRKLNPEVYYSLVQSAEQFTNYDEIAQAYPNRTQGDLDEEVFIHELAKYIVGLNSEIQNLPEDIKHEILYTTQSIIDSALMGNYSARTLINPYNKSISQLSHILDSDACQLEDSLVMKAAKESRELANIKQQLIENNELQEECD